MQARRPAYHRQLRACVHALAAFRHPGLKRQPSELMIEDLDVGLVRAFLEHIEEGRDNTARSRNARLAAIKAFFRLVEQRRPVCLEQAMMIRALPVKRTDTRLIDYLTREEIQALLAAPNAHTPSGLRDRAMLHLAYAAGLRASRTSRVADGRLPRQVAFERASPRQGKAGTYPAALERNPDRAARSLAVRPGDHGPELFLNRDGQRMRPR